MIRRICGGDFWVSFCRLPFADLWRTPAKNCWAAEGSILDVGLLSVDSFVVEVVVAVDWQKIREIKI